MNKVNCALMLKALTELEAKIEQLSVPLLAMDHDRMVQASAELHQALVESAGIFREFKLSQNVPRVLVRRLQADFARVIALREGLNRMTASIDRALEVLIPKAAGSVYGRYQAQPLTPSGHFASCNA